MRRVALLTVAALGAAPVLAQEWIPLQDGKSLAGWKAAESPDSWKVEKGVFVSRGERSHLFYVGDVANHEFRNFELSAQVMTSPGANSGIYVHTKWQGPGWPEAGYEMQVINSNPPAERAASMRCATPGRRPRKTTRGSTTASASSARPSRPSSTGG